MYEVVSCGYILTTEKLSGAGEFVDPESFSVVLVSVLLLHEIETDITSKGAMIFLIIIIK